MRIEEQQHGAVKIITPQGALVEADAPVIKGRLLESLLSTHGRFVVDLSAAPFVDSKGLEALLDVSEEMARSGQTLRICSANKTIREVLDLTDLAPLFDQFDDVTSAVRSFL
ncbi:MAG TPA: STAS domain-containing protein [Tepidisphaeraceae bacterium]|jgi:anti-anti-sigma factor|nr:STAS domain-containing protein [Tepidisphaeraceae bacterium]